MARRKLAQIHREPTGRASAGENGHLGVGMGNTPGLRIKGREVDPDRIVTMAVNVNGENKAIFLTTGDGAAVAAGEGVEMIGKWAGGRG